MAHQIQNSSDNTVKKENDISQTPAPLIPTQPTIPDWNTSIIDQHSYSSRLRALSYDINVAYKHLSFTDEQRIDILQFFIKVNALPFFIAPLLLFLIVKIKELLNFSRCAETSAFFLFLFYIAVLGVVAILSFSAWKIEFGKHILKSKCLNKIFSFCLFYCVIYTGSFGSACETYHNSSYFAWLLNSLLLGCIMREKLKFSFCRIILYIGIFGLFMSLIFILGVWILGDWSQTLKYLPIILFFVSLKYTFYMMFYRFCEEKKEIWTFSKFQLSIPFGHIC